MIDSPPIPRHPVSGQLATQAEGLAASPQAGPPEARRSVMPAASLVAEQPAK